MNPLLCSFIQNAARRLGLQRGRILGAPSREKPRQERSCPATFPGKPDQRSVQCRGVRRCVHMEGVSQQGMQWECERGGAGRDQVPGKDRWGVVGVAAAPHQGGFIPGSLQAGRCLITCEGNTVVKPEFYTLNPGGTDLVWAAAAEGKVPLGAVQGGVSESGEDLYIGRCKIDGKKLHGKVQPSQQGCLVPLAGGEANNSSYEVLCARTVLTNFKNAARRVSSPGSSVVTRLSSLAPISPISPLSPTKRRPLRGSGESWRRLTPPNSGSNLLQLPGYLKSAVTRTTSSVKSRKLSGPGSPSSPRAPTPRTTSPGDLTFVTPKSRVGSPRTPTSHSPRPYATSHSQPPAAPAVTRPPPARPPPHAHRPPAHQSLPSLPHAAQTRIRRRVSPWKTSPGQLGEAAGAGRSPTPMLKGGRPRHGRRADSAPPSRVPGWGSHC
ncbi:Natterin-4 [Penaeus vannamei]|uniref:Natterin-4 n=1 Tax=Penaeus vannamei TaxID=6689 RepID=A0A3R7STT2_PENVA|nr:Natterin-4 [Penaeus vannamei]